MIEYIKTISNHNYVLYSYMEREIVLSSYSVKDQGNNTPSDFVTQFTRPLRLDDNKQYAIGLNRIINMSFTWFNVNAGYDNQLIKYSKDGGLSFTNISFPAGVWNYTDFNAYIREATVIKQANKEDEYPIDLTFDDTTFRVTIELKQNYQLDLTQSNFYDLIGFDKEIVTQTKTGPRVPYLSVDTDLLNVRCNLVNNSLVDGEDSDIIFSFSTSVLRCSYSFTMEPRRVTFNPINKNSISVIRIQITDGKRRIINLNGADTSFSLILKQIV